VTGKSRGYGFVRFVSETTAATARKEMNGQVFILFFHFSYLFKMNSLFLYQNLWKYADLLAKEVSFYVIQHCYVWILFLILSQILDGRRIRVTYAHKG